MPDATTTPSRRRSRNCHNCGAKGIPRTNKFCSIECWYIHQRRHPHTFVKGHRDLVPADARARQAVTVSGGNNGRWKGDGAGYVAKHNWVRRAFGSPMTCEQCGSVCSSRRRIQWANISGRYLRQRSDWKRLCASCHKKYDLAKSKNN